MKNILFVHYGLDWIRGSERCLLDLLANIDHQRFNPLVWCNSDVMAAEVRKLGIRVVVNRFPLLMGWHQPRFDIKAYIGLVFKAIRLIKFHHIDLIHCNSGAPCQWMIPAAKLMCKPVLAHLHARYGLRERCSFFLHQATHIVGASNAVLEKIHEDGFPRDCTQVIYNGVSVALPKCDANNDIRSLLNLDKQHVLFATISSLVTRKGIDLLIRAVNELKSTAPLMRLLVIGDGPERFALQTLVTELGVQKQVIFLGERNDVSSLLTNGVDVLVSGAREEVFGLTLAEAGAAHLPVIAPAVGGIPEVVENGVTGILVRPECPEHLARAMNILYSNSKLRAAMGTHARKRVVSRFNVDRYVQDLHLCYDTVIENYENNSIYVAPIRCLNAYYAWIFGYIQRRLQHFSAKALAGE